MCISVFQKMWLYLITLIYLIDASEEAASVHHTGDGSIRIKRQSSIPCPPLLSTDTYDATCGSAVCESNSEEGATATIACKPNYVFRGTRINPQCRNGTWTPYPTPCQPECGQKNLNRLKRLINGTNTTPGEYPWVVAIYQKRENTNTFICGGSIITRSYVITAAHCLTDASGVPNPKENYAIAAGKFYSAWDVIEDSVQIRKIKRIYVHEDYRGRLQKYRDDIALIEVEKFDITARVQPVCVDWANSYEEQDLQDSNIAVFAGWGFTREDSRPSETLKQLDLPYRSTNVCRQNMQPDFFEQFYSSNSICAGYKDEGKSICSGDAGGGLYFKSEPTTFYIRGVASLTPRSAIGCSSNEYSLYTRVSKYLPWIEGITGRNL